MATIYKLICDDPELVYYGSTKEPLWKRLSHHKSRYLYPQDCGNYSSKKLFQVGGVKIVELEKCKIEDRYIREDYYIKNFPCVNEIKAMRTEEEKKEYQKCWAREKRKKNGNDYDKIYYQKIKEERNKPIICECGSTTSKNNFIRHKQSQIHQVRMFLKQIEESNVAMPE